MTIILSVSTTRERDALLKQIRPDECRLSKIDNRYYFIFKVTK